MHPGDEAMLDLQPFSAAGPLDPFAWTAARNFGAASRARPHVLADDGSDVADGDKPAYGAAAAMLAAFDVVLDLGCGSGEGSAPFARTAGLVQTDRRDRRSPAGREGGSFRTVSPERWDDLDALHASLPADRALLIVCSGLLERVYDPRPLLAFLRRALLLNPDNRVLLATPDHERAEGTAEAVLPSRRDHVRQWSVFSLGALLRSLGLDVLRYGLARDANGIECAIVAELSCSAGHLAGFLARAGLPEPSRRLLVTSEHKATGRGGGIGTYAHHSEAVLARPGIVLFHGPDGHAPEAVMRNRQWLHAAVATTPPGEEPAVAHGPSTPEAVLDAATTLLCLYPDLQWIEYEDYLGYAFQIAQAKEAGLLPRRLTTVCYCHGNHHYLEINYGRFYFDAATHARERVCIERSDLTLMPSEYLDSIYRRAGLRPRNRQFVGAPYAFRYDAPEEAGYGPVETILFFGKKTKGKGYHLFVDAINALARSGRLDRIRRVIVAGVGGEDAEFADEIKSKVEFTVFPTTSVLDEIRALTAGCVAVIPYLGDNFPYSVHELIDAGMQTVFARAGGVPEVYRGCDPDDAATFDPTPAALAEKLAAKLDQSGPERGREARALHLRFRVVQDERNRRYAGLDFGGGAARPPIETAALPAYAVIITFHNEEARHLRDALDGLAGQSVLPSRVVVVDDWSRDDARRAAQEVVGQERRLNVTMVRPERNLGLSGARNFGMAQIEEDYFLAHDVDNVLRADAVDFMLTALVADPQAGAATAHSVIFQDAPDWIDAADHVGAYKPTAPDLGEFHWNTFGDALAMYRRARVEAAGGWRSTGREPLEDYELFYRMQALRFEVLPVPRQVLLYRVREGSMLRTYDRFRGYMRAADVLTEKVGRDGLSIVRNAVAGTWRAGFTHDEAYDPYTPHSPEMETLLALMRAALPPKLRDLTMLERVLSGPSWKVVAFRHPLRVRHWMAIRRMQREARRLDLRRDAD